MNESSRRWRAHSILSLAHPWSPVVGLGWGGATLLLRYKIVEKEVVVEKEVEKEIIEKIVIGQRAEDIAEQERLRQGVRGALLSKARRWLVASAVLLLLVCEVWGFVSFIDGVRQQPNCLTLIIGNNDP